MIEPNDSLLTRIATRLGLATEVEPVGNYVYRFSRHDVMRIARSLFSPWGSASLFAVHRVARGPIEFAILRFLNAVANWIASSQGNTFIFVIHKSE